jgi:hypothetical protein
MIKFVRDDIRWCSLKYREENLEKEYQLEKEQYQRWSFIFIYTSLSAISIILWAQGFWNSSSLSNIRLLINLVRLFSSIFLYLFVKLLPRWIEEISIIMIPASTIIYVETNRSDFPFSLISDLFLSGILIQTLYVVFIMVTVRFPKIIFALGFFNFYSNMRFFYFESLNQFGFRALIFGICNTFFLSSVAFGKEITKGKSIFE